MANLSNINNKFLVTTGGNVGINSTSPSQKLVVIGNISTSGSVLFNDNQGVNFGNSNAKINGSSSDGIKFFGSGSEKMRLTQVGNVGIGTDNPDRRLHVNSGTDNANTIFESTDTAVTVRFKDSTGETELECRNDWRFSNNAGADERMRIDSSGNVGIGTASPASKFEVYGGNSGVNDVDRYIRFKASNGEKRFDFYVGGTGNASSLGMYTSDGTTKNVQIASGGTSYFNGGNLGIGTTSPSGALHVKSSTATTTGMVRLQNDMDNNYETLRVESLGNYDAHIGFHTNGTSDYWWGIGIDYSDSGKFKISGDNILSVNPRLTIDTSGNVGIGTTSPSKKLHVKESASATYAVEIENTLAGGDYMVMIGDAGDNVFEFDSSGTGGEAQMKMYSDGVLKANIMADGNSYFNGGNVGIGTTTPRSKLDVNGRITQEYSNVYQIKQGSTEKYYYSNGASYNAFGVGVLGIGTTSDAIQFATSNVVRATINSSGNVGIGTTSPSKQLMLYGNTPFIRLEDTQGGSKRLDLWVDSNAVAYIDANQSAQQITFRTASTDRLRITNAGNVGIGTTTPSKKLDVSGVVRQSGTNNFDNIIVKTGNTGSFTFTSAELKAQMIDNVGFFIMVTVYRPTTDVSNDVGSLMLHGIMPRGSASTFSTISTLKGTGISTLTATNGGTGNDLVVTTDSGTTFRCSIRVMAMGGTS